MKIRHNLLTTAIATLFTTASFAVIPTQQQLENLFNNVVENAQNGQVIQARDLPLMLNGFAARVETELPIIPVLNVNNLFLEEGFAFQDGEAFEYRFWIGQPIENPGGSNLVATIVIRITNEDFNLLNAAQNQLQEQNDDEI